MTEQEKRGGGGATLPQNPFLHLRNVIIKPHKWGRSGSNSKFRLIRKGQEHFCFLSYLNIRNHDAPHQDEGTVENGPEDERNRQPTHLCKLFNVCEGSESRKCLFFPEIT